MNCVDDKKIVARLTSKVDFFNKLIPILSYLTGNSVQIYKQNPNQ